MKVPTKVTDSELVSARHAELVAAATDLFLQKGFHKTSVRDIAQRVGWPVGKLYLYISCKDDLLYLITRAIMDSLWERLRQVHEYPSATDTFKEVATAIFKATDEMRRQVRLVYRESKTLRPEYLEDLKDSERRERELVAQVVRRGIAQGEFRPVQPEIIAHNLIAMAHMWALKTWALRDFTDFDSYFQTQLGFLLEILKPVDTSRP